MTIRPTSLTTFFSGLLLAGLVPLGLGLSASGCGGSSSGSGSVGNTTNGIVMAPLTNAVLTNGIQDRIYRQTFTPTSGGTAPYTFSNLNNALPPGLFLITTAANGAALTTATQTDVVGFPQQTGATNVTFQVIDSNNNRTDPFYTLTVTPRPGAAALTINPTNGTILAGGTTTTAYVNTLSVGNGTGNFNWRVVYGALPPGLIFTPNPTGSNVAQAGISGMPTQAGVFFFGVEVNDSSALQQASGGIYQITIQ